MADFSPDDITRQRFNTAFRGFDPAEVRQYLQTLAAAVSKLVEERDQMAAKLSGLGERDLKAEFESVGREVSAVLESAREAADQLRQRAANDATRWRSEAVAEAEAEMRKARADAEQLRGDAWSTADELLKQVMAEAERIEATTEKERLRLVGEAEREAHRVVAAGRREAEDLVRNAKAEADRLTITAQTSHDELIERATRQADAAQERTRALEIRRQELKAELDSIRHALATAEGELEERRSALQLSPQSDRPEPAPSVEPEQADDTPKASDEWTPGETVRVVRPGGSGHDARTTVGAINEASEIVVLSPEQVKARRQAEEPKSDEDTPRRETPSEEGQDDPGPVASDEPEDEARAPVSAGHVAEQSEEDETHNEDAATTPDFEDAPESPQAVAEERAEQKDGAEPTVDTHPPADTEPTTPIPPDVDHVEDGDRFEELSGLFARLRDPVEVETEVDTADTEAVSKPAGAEKSTPEVSEPTPKAAWGGDPFELRSRLLLPVSNRALRNIKRQLTEAQNEALEELRLSDGEWDPDGPTLGARLRPDLVVLSAESFAAGHTAAMEMAEARFKRPPTPKTEPEIPWVAGLLGDLNHSLAEGRKQGQGARQLGASVSRVFRAWRTDEAERRVAELGSERYHVGLSEVLLENGYATGWVISGRGCTTCRSRTETLPSEWETLPPAHPNCHCTLVLV